MTHQDPLDQLREALDIAPSPEFTARVRQQVATEQRRAVWWSLPHLATAAAAVCLVSVAVVVWSRSAGPGVRPAAPEPVAAVTPARPTSPQVSVVDSQRVGGGARATPVQASLAQPAAPEGVFAETLVPDDQRIALERLIGAIRAGRTTVPAGVAEDIVDEDGRRMPRALVIEPLKLDPIK